jgi:hypothetical protein
MVKHIERDVAPDNLNAHDAAAIINHALSSTRSQPRNDFFNDDLIVSLADSYENKRARQVTEWEMRQRVAKAV